MRMSPARFALAGLLAAFVAAVPGRAAAADLTAVIGQHKQLSEFAAALKLAGLDQDLRSGTFTVLAPNNAAMNVYLGTADIELVEDMAPAQRRQLRAVLDHLITRGMRRLPAAGTTDRAPMLDGHYVTLSSAPDGRAWADDADVIEPSIAADNGHIIEIDKVIAPPARP